MFSDALETFQFLGHKIIVQCGTHLIERNDFFNIKNVELIQLNGSRIIQGLDHMMDNQAIPIPAQNIFPRVFVLMWALQCPGEK